MERHRSQLIGMGIIAGVFLISAFVFLGANQPVYACSIQLDPVSPTPGASIVGQREDDMTRGHVAVGTSVTYTFCPPASGQHYNASGEGPIAPRFYGPDDITVPQGWVHNLEHGALVILYNCARAGCDTASLDQLKQLATTFPESPRCKLPGTGPGAISPVITRFDQMKANFAALIWDRVLFQDTLDTRQMLEFFKNVGETTNPEVPPTCASPSPSASASASAEPSASGSPGASASGSAVPSGSAASSPAASGASAAPSASAPSSAPESAAAPSASAAPSST